MNNPNTTSIQTLADLETLKGKIFEDREKSRLYGHITHISRDGRAMYIQGDDGQRYFTYVSNFVARLKESEFLPTLLDRVTFFKSDKEPKEGLLPQAITVNLTDKPLGDTTVYTGIVKWIDPNKGYGFCRNEVTNEDVFIATSLYDYPRILQKDVRLSFNLIPMEGKAPLAINIKVIRTESDINTEDET